MNIIYLGLGMLAFGAVIALIDYLGRRQSKRERKPT